MASIDAKLIKALRDKTGMGITDCKNALIAAEGDLDQAELNLRKRQQEKAIKKAENKEAQKIYKTLVDMRKKLDDALNKTSDLMAKVRKFEKNGPALEKTLKALDNQNSDFAKIFDKVFPVVVNLTLSGAGAGVGIKEAKTTLETFNSALGLANDILSEGKGQLEELLG